MKKYDLRSFDPEIFAKLDGDMWIAYYHHNFFQLFILLIKLNFQYFHANVIAAFRAAYFSARAAIIFRKTKGYEDQDAVLRYLEKFFKELSDHNVTPFNYRCAAEKEYYWWIVDRYPNKHKTTRAEALADAMAEVYRLPASALLEYGTQRAAAMELLGEYHSNTNTHVDWERLRAHLSRAYSAVRKAVNNQIP